MIHLTWSKEMMILNIAGAESKANNVAVHKSQVSHVETHNGKEVIAEKTEQKGRLNKECL